MTPMEAVTWVTIIFFAVILFGTLGVIIGAVIYTIKYERQEKQTDKEVGDKD